MHKIFPRLYIEEFEAEIPKCEVKCRWQTQRDKREDENRKKHQREKSGTKKHLPCRKMFRKKARKAAGNQK